MRIIKFNVWDIDREMLFRDVFNLKKDSIDMWGSLEKRTSNNVKWLQFTGLKDINGKEIYEGDLVLGYTKPHEVVFIDCAFYLKNKDSHLRLSRTCGALEVIGNIYENHELLTQS